MLIGIDSSPCSLSLRNRSTLCSTTKCHQNISDSKNVLVQKSFFSISSILSIPIMLFGNHGGYFSAICRVCFWWFSGVASKLSFIRHTLYHFLSVFSVSPLKVCLVKVLRIVIRSIHWRRFSTSYQFQNFSVHVFFSSSTWLMLHP